MKKNKKILLVNFSISNGGDYLIEERMNNLFKYYYKYDDITIINGYKTQKIDFNSYDFAVLGGGPYFDDRIINDLFIPLIDFSSVKIPIHLFGCGIYGNNCSKQSIISKNFNSNSINFFENITKFGGTLGCRDAVTYFVMKHNGFKNVFLTGCPAWYDIDNINKEYCFNTSTSVMKKIVISDPGLTKNQDEHNARALQAIDVIKKIISLFPKASILFTFNNGINTKYSSGCNNLIFDFLKKNNIEIVELNNRSDLFSKYDSFDLHIGFRVHSHIYSLSKRIPSILIEEDVRGFGMNETFGLPHLLSYNEKMMNNGIYEPNSNLCIEIENLLDYFNYTDFFVYKQVFSYLDYFFFNIVKKWFNYIGANNE